MASADPFERAAKLEEKEELKREIKRESMLRRIGRRGNNPIGALAFPWAIWALIRASYFEFGDPTIPQSIVRFFFKSGAPLFTVLTVLVLLTIWATVAGGALGFSVTGDDD